MMMPSIFGENLFDDFDSWFSDPVEKRFFGKNPARLCRTRFSAEKWIK